MYDGRGDSGVAISVAVVVIRYWASVRLPLSCLNIRSSIMRNKGAPIISGLILILALLGWWGYDTYFRPDPVVQEQLAEQFGADFFEPDTADALPPAKQAMDSTDDSFTKEFLKEREEQQAVKSYADPQPVDTSSSPNPISEQAIIDKYAPQFYALEQFTNNRLEEIYTAADQEYGEQSRAGTLNHAAWTQKYLQACLNLQSSVDPKFYSLVDSMEAELKANHQPTSIIDEIKKEYTASKYQKIKELIARAHGQ